MSPLQSCLVGQTKPFGEKNQQDRTEKKPEPLKKLKWIFFHACILYAMHNDILIRMQQATLRLYMSTWLGGER